MTDIDCMSYYLGIEIKKKGEDGIFVNQKKFANRGLCKSKYSNWIWSEAII